MISWISTAIPHASNARVTWLIVPTTCYGSGSPFEIGGSMSDWPVGLSTGCFYQQRIFDCLETISRRGFNIIEALQPATIDHVEKQLRNDKRLNKLHYIFEMDAPQSPAKQLQYLIVLKEIAAHCRRWVRLSLIGWLERFQFPLALSTIV
jgi:hypothetical protein